MRLLGLLFIFPISRSFLSLLSMYPVNIGLTRFAMRPEIAGIKKMQDEINKILAKIVLYFLEIMMDEKIRPTKLTNVRNAILKKTSNGNPPQSIWNRGLE